ALPRADQNLIVYSGFSPFVGAGTNLGGWSFVVDISRPSTTLGYTERPEPFTVDQLYDAIERRLEDAGLEGLALKDYFFVSGRDIRENREILPDLFGRPTQVLEAKHVMKYVTGSDSHVRHYKWIRVHDWGQELIMSYMLRCSLHGSNLYVEITRFVLTPLADQYRRIDHLKEPGAVESIGALLVALIAGPVRAVFTPLILLGRMNEAMGELFGGKEKARRKLIENNPQFDYGAGQGFRQALASSQFLHYFQKADGDFYTKMLDQTMLEGVVKFLDERGIDTSDIRERQTTILNSGIIVHGGDVSAESLAVGAGAQSVKTQTTEKKKARSKGAGA
ncbi:MAG: hypothetical protein KGN84_19455, partial [Acidobacteriota bacterium]|nr:hypothetical protein [Acidobacteriota bacterium]